MCFGDCTDAFLQSDLLEEIYVEPPVEAQEPANVVWRLHKALPGLKGGPVAWGARIDGILGGSPLDFRRSLVDPCLWTHSTTGVRIGRHMDDFIMTGPFDAVQAVMQYLERAAKLKVTGVLDQLWQADAILGLFHHPCAWCIHDSDGHRDLAGRSTRPKSGALQAVETSWCFSSDSRSHAAGSRQSTSCIAGWLAVSYTAVLIAETLLSHSISCAVASSLRQ